MDLCDLQTGQCGPSPQLEEEIIDLTPLPQAEVLFVTDPVCSHCWAMEPGWRKFLYFYRSFVSVRYIYGGLLPSWDGFDRGGITGPATLIPHFAEVARLYGQPIETSLWSKDPPASSFPASIALHIVRALQPASEEAALRRIRQAVFLEARNIARPEVLADCVADVGLDRQQFLDVFEQGQGKKAFQRDLQETQELGVRGFPTLIFKGKNNLGVILRGGQSFGKLEQALIQLTDVERVDLHPSVSDVVRAYGSGTTIEFADILNLSKEQTAQILTAVGVQKRALAGDALWSAV